MVNRNGQQGSGITSEPRPVLSEGANLIPESLSKLVKLGTGLSIWHGTIAVEYLADLRPWTKEFRVYQQMADDAVVGSLIEAIKAPLISTGFGVEAGGDTDADKRAVEFIKNDMDKMRDMSWREHMDEMLDFVVFGFAIAEKVLEKRKDGLLHLATLAPVAQDTLYKWGEPDTLGRVTSFIQQGRGQHAGMILEVPMDKILHFVFRQRNRNPQGRSLLRSLYRSWYFKSNLESIEAIGAERDVGNVPVVTLGEQGYSDGDITLIKDMMDGFRIDENAYLIMPPSTTVAAYGGGAKVYDIRQMIKDYGHLIRQRFFADFVSLGGERVGTQALSREAQSFFFKALISIQNMMVEVWNRQLVPYMFRWNEGQFDGLTKNDLGEPIYPKIVWKNPGRLDINNLANTARTLVAANLLTPNRDLENHFRQQADLPPLKHDEKAVSEKEEMLPTTTALPGRGGGSTEGESQVKGGAKAQDAQAKKAETKASEPHEFTLGAEDDLSDTELMGGNLMIAENVAIEVRSFFSRLYSRHGGNIGPREIDEFLNQEVRFSLMKMFPKHHPKQINGMMEGVVPFVKMRLEMDGVISQNAEHAEYVIKDQRFLTGGGRKSWKPVAAYTPISAVPMDSIPDDILTHWAANKEVFGYASIKGLSLSQLSDLTSVMKGGLATPGITRYGDVNSYKLRPEREK